MDVSRVIRIFRDIYNRCGFSSLSGVYAEQKEDGSTVTDIDPLVEEIILEHLCIDDDEVACVREESNGQAQTIAQIKAKAFLLTIDGIDGTGDFIRHFNRSEKNSKWLVGMTAYYEKEEDGLYSPKYAFAMQPNENRLFFFAEDRSILIEEPLGRCRLFQLRAAYLKEQPKCGSLDVYLDKPECQWKLKSSTLKVQSGPSGFNTASLAAATAPFNAFAGSESINFTTFHYKLWDFGLWPVLRGAGVNTTIKSGNDLNVVERLNLNWFGEDGASPGKCDATPIILGNDQAFDPFAAEQDNGDGGAE